MLVTWCGGTVRSRSSVSQNWKPFEGHCPVMQARAVCCFGWGATSAPPGCVFRLSLATSGFVGTPEVGGELSPINTCDVLLRPYQKAENSWRCLDPYAWFRIFSFLRLNPPELFLRTNGPRLSVISPPSSDLFLSFEHLAIGSSSLFRYVTQVTA